MTTKEATRLKESQDRIENWKRWGPYLAERQWGTVREDYSADGNFWDHFTHDQSRSRAYRWGEDGILGFTDRECRLCFALTMWNGKDPILKERYFGTNGPEGNHGEDVKEYYTYDVALPTYAYCKSTYLYPQDEYPYSYLVKAAQEAGKNEPEYELADTGIFDDDRYWEITAEYGKKSANDVLIEITVTNKGPKKAKLTLMPTLWFRNTWSWDCSHEGCTLKPHLYEQKSRFVAEHQTLGRFELSFPNTPDDKRPVTVFTDNHTNMRRLFGQRNSTRYVKDAFHKFVIDGKRNVVNPQKTGTKAAAIYELEADSGESIKLRLRLQRSNKVVHDVLGDEFTHIMDQRRAEVGEYYDTILPKNMPEEHRSIAMQAYAGLLFGKQFYHYIIEDWLKGDPSIVEPPEGRQWGRNHQWKHLFNRDVISMPDKWEFPWYASWDLAFHMLPMAQVDTDFAKKQCLLFLREWYMHPNGHLPAYEMDLSDVNPPVHAWACRRVYEMDAQRTGKADYDFLARCFQKLLLNFTWWVNRKDHHGKNIFSGGFLGLDNIGVFDRSYLPVDGELEQADATAWMSFFCANMLWMSMELALHDPVYEDMATKFFEHFVHVCDAINREGEKGKGGLWDDELGLYRDQLHAKGKDIPIPVRSIVGLLPLAAVLVIEQKAIDKLPMFKKRLHWFLTYRKDLAKYVSYLHTDKDKQGEAHRLLAIPSRKRLERMLQIMLDESEFLSPFGIRSLSIHHKDKPYVFKYEDMTFCIDYEPGESTTSMFGGNSNWRGPVWMPINYLFIEALYKYHHFYGDDFKMEYPTGSGNKLTIKQIADKIGERLTGLFTPNAEGHRPSNLGLKKLLSNPTLKNSVFFHEYFHADTGKGLGASHQTGWTALIALLLHQQAGDALISYAHHDSACFDDEEQEAVIDKAAMV